jgi:prophage lambdaSa04, minor structural protein, putative
MLDSLLVFKNKGEVGAIPLNADNVNYNFNLIKQLLNVFHPIGEYFETSDVNFDPNVSWGGTWVLDNDGTVLVSKSNEKTSVFNADVGTIKGAEKHTLTISEIPPHRHNVNLSSATDTGINKLVTSSWSWSTENQENNNLMNNVGGGNPHNNIQPSKIIYRWHRKA